jgi:hypothetical protein
MLEMVIDDKRCSFCGATWKEGDRFLGGLGAFICRACAVRASGLLTSDEPQNPVAPWANMTTEELLAVLPDIVATSEQVDEFLHGWVSMVRERGASWQKIGLALGVSRQAAWERFTRVNRALAKDADRG